MPARERIEHALSYAEQINRWVDLWPIRHPVKARLILWTWVMVVTASTLGNPHGLDGTLLWSMF